MKSIKTLEFDKILKKLSAFADTDGAAEAILELVPSTDEVVIKRMLAECKAAFDMLTVKGRPPFGKAKNILYTVDRAVKGAVLSTSELLAVASLLRTAAEVKKYGARKDDTVSPLDIYFSAIIPLPLLARSITDAIIAEDIIADTASDTLLKIRKSIKKCESTIHDSLASLLSGSYSKYLQENIVTQRSGRYVVPVKAEYKSAVSGIVHDTSASGSTVFIEPMSVVEANNKLREYKIAEKNEIDAILYALSQSVAGAYDTIRTDYKAVTDLAVIFAKACFASDMLCIFPEISSANRVLRLIKARHPLIDRDKVVPISLEFGQKQHSMIITGPNTGGKTVTLKTIGLFAMMVQSGIPIPADHGTCLPVFTQILADIGDEQSIEQSLSTFSAHMTNIVDILTECDSTSLVLFDELGAGTDPVEGASLAMAILETTRKMGALTVATTHYSELKLYAIENDDVLNASCEFDVNTLRPTYRLITGLPGKSNAFAISLRLGLAPDIIERANQLTNDDNKRLENVLTRLTESERELQVQREKAAKALEEAEKALQKAKKDSEKLMEKANTELDKAQTEAVRIVTKARNASEYVLSRMTELQRQNEKELTKKGIDDARQSMRATLNSAENDMRSSAGKNEDYVPPRPFRLGDEVLLADVNKVGIIKALSGDTATVQAGIIQVKTPLSNLRFNEEKKKQKALSTSSIERTSSAFKPDIDVRGLNGDDAWFVIDSFLDEAMLSTFSAVTVIHGKGTGALKNALWSFFKHDKRIATFRSGRYGEGDGGVTVIELKK